MKHLLLTTIAAVVLVGCSDSKIPLFETTGSWSNDILLFSLIQLVFIFVIYWSYSSIKTEIKDGWTVSGGGENLGSISRIKKSDHPISFYYQASIHYVILVITLSFIVISSYGLLKTDIFRSAIRNDIEAVKQHLNDGTEVNAKNRSGATPLHSAAQNGRKEIAELLIAKGAEVNAKDKDGETPLDLASGATAELLRKHGGMTVQELRTGVTPLHAAAREGIKEVVELLIAAGAYVNAKITSGGSNKNKTPLDFAIQYKKPETANLLRSYGGKTGDELKAEGK
jgi:hypothetical protein